MASNLERAGELIKTRLEAVNPKTWVELTPSGLTMTLVMDLQEAGLLALDEEEWTCAYGGKNCEVCT